LIQKDEEVEPMVGIAPHRPDVGEKNSNNYEGFQKIDSTCEGLFHPELLAILLAIKNGLNRIHWLRGTIWSARPCAVGNSSSICRPAVVPLSCFFIPPRREPVHEGNRALEADMFRIFLK
jgi:hypothetical protein